MDGNNWRELHQAELLELTLDKLEEHVKAAEAAIQDARFALNVFKAGIKACTPSINDSEF